MRATPASAAESDAARAACCARRGGVAARCEMVSRPHPSVAARRRRARPSFAWWQVLIRVDDDGRVRGHVGARAVDDGVELVWTGVNAAWESGAAARVPRGELLVGRRPRRRAAGAVGRRRAAAALRNLRAKPNGQGIGDAPPSRVENGSSRARRRAAAARVEREPPRCCSLGRAADGAPEDVVAPALEVLPVGARRADAPRRAAAPRPS